MSKNHLTKQRLSGTQKKRGDNEYSCLSCGTSITVNPSTGQEYGHKRSCTREINDRWQQKAREGNEVLRFGATAHGRQE